MQPPHPPKQAERPARRYSAAPIICLSSENPFILSDADPPDLAQLISVALRSLPGSFLHRAIGPVHHRARIPALHRANLRNGNRDVHLSRFFESQGQWKGLPFLERLLLPSHPALHAARAAGDPSSSPHFNGSFLAR